MHVHVMRVGQLATTDVSVTYAYGAVAQHHVCRQPWSLWDSRPIVWVGLGVVCGWCLVGSKW